MPPPILEISLPAGPNFEMIFVEGGEFTMGDDQSESKSAHRVNVPSFYMGKYPVIQALWTVVMKGKNPSFFKGDNRPVEQVSWEDAHRFIEKLNRLTGKIFRFPSEAEWEYAARGGQYSQGYVYSGSDKLKQVGWYKENSDDETHEVGLLLGNELGLHDMSGNVWEWCEDDWHDDYSGAPNDGSAWIDAAGRGEDRVVRGGGFFDFAVGCRPATRIGSAPDSRDNGLGFRLALSLQSGG